MAFVLNMPVDKPVEKGSGISFTIEMKGFVLCARGEWLVVKWYDDV